MLKFAEYIKESEASTYHDFVTYCENNNVEVNEANFRNWMRTLGTGAAMALGATGAYGGEGYNLLHRAAGTDPSVVRQAPTLIPANASPSWIKQNLSGVFAQYPSKLMSLLNKAKAEHKDIKEIHIVSGASPGINVIYFGKPGADGRQEEQAHFYPFIK